MYTTVEGEVRNGRVVPIEEGILPEAGHVLIVILPDTERREPENVRPDQFGWLQMKEDAARWERQIRGEWDARQ